MSDHRRISSQSWAIADLPGLSAAHQAQLATAGIHTTFDLLHQGQTARGRQTLAAQLKLHVQYVNRWVALADLARIPSVGCQYCGLLLHAGVSSPPTLATMPLARLHQQVQRFYVQTMRRRDLSPAIEQVAGWIQEARHLRTRVE